MKFCLYSRFWKYLVLLNSILIIISVLTVKSLWAHKIGESYIYLRVYENKLAGIFHITLGDLNKALGTKTPDAQITGDNIADRISEVHSYYKQNVQFLDGDISLPIRFTGLDMMPVNEASNYPGNYVLIEFTIIENATTPEIIEIDYNVLFNKDPDHIGLLGIEYYWRAGIFENKSQMSLIFSPEDHRQQLYLAKQSLFQGFITVVKLGIMQIWKSIDHILFIIALTLPAAMLRKQNDWHPVINFQSAIFYLIKIVTLFTIAHTIALSIAAIGHITLPSWLVESVIAICIAIAALDIIFPIFKRTISWVVFVFGLFQGFAIASALTRLGVLGEHMALSLFGFNLGVATGQILIIFIIFPYIYLIRNSVIYPKYIMRYGAVAIILLAIFWFVDRTFLGIDVRGMVKDSISVIIN